MLIREMLEQREFATLSPAATCAANSRGRVRPLEPCPLRTCFQRDRDRIIHSKAFRRLSHKTQVFISPEGDHYRARLTHTLEVAQIGRTIARALRLNEDLTEAMAMGHDLGHTPFGHAGERVLNEMCSEGFRHNEQSLRVIDRLERDGTGLNLTWEVRNGIVCHTGTQKADTPEGRILHYADQIAYINHDIDDSIRAGILSEEDIPSDIRLVLGKTHGERIDSLVLDMIAYGQRTGDIGLSPEVDSYRRQLRAFMFEHVYRHPVAKGEEGKAMDMLRSLFTYFLKHVDQLPADYLRLMDTDSKERVVCDYIAGMTDRFSVAKYSSIFIPKSWNIK